MDQESRGDVFFDLTELARLNYDQGKYAEALGYYEEDVRTLDSRNWEQKAPGDFAGLLEEYSACLKKAGREQDARTLDTRLAAIKAKNPVLTVHSERTPYGKNPLRQLPKSEGESR